MAGKGWKKSEDGKWLPPDELAEAMLSPDEISTGEQPAEGEPPLSGVKKRRKARRTDGKKLNLSGMESLFYSVHLSLATMTQTPELALEEEECAKLARAAENVAQHYDLPDLPQKTIDWAYLLYVLALMYGTRLVAIRARLGEQKS